MSKRRPDRDQQLIDSLNAKLLIRDHQQIVEPDQHLGSQIRSGAAAFHDKMVEMGGQMTGDPVMYLNPADNDNGDDTWVICQTCRIPLNAFTAVDGGETEWLHTRTWQEHDHEPVPIRAARKEAVDALCDFCGNTKKLPWVFTGDRVQVRDGNTVSDYGLNWSCCADCAVFVDSQDLEGLFKHVYRVSPTTRNGRDGFDKAVAYESWMALWRAYVPTIHAKRYIGPPIEPAKLNPRLMPKIQLGLLRLWRSETVRDIGEVALTDFDCGLPGVHVGDEDTFMVRYPPGTQVSPSGWRNHVQHLAAGIGTSELYWISENFTRLAVHAGKRFEKLIITREELPSNFGIMIFAEPIDELQRNYGQTAAIRAVSWTLVPGGIWLNLYIQGEDGDPDVTDVVEMRRELGYLLCPNGGSGFPFGTEMDAPAEGSYDFITTILATWALLKQPGVANIEQAPVDTKYARSYKREYGRPLPPVQLVDLRKRPRRKPKPGGTGKPLDYRVLRHAHWKRQFYGTGRALRRWIYIDDYIAGPEDAPFREPRQKVNILR